MNNTLETIIRDVLLVQRNQITTEMGTPSVSILTLGKQRVLAQICIVHLTCWFDLCSSEARTTSLKRPSYFLCTSKTPTDSENNDTVCLPHRSGCSCSCFAHNLCNILIIIAGFA